MASNEPAIGAMRAATPSAKMSVAADLKYQFDGEVIAGQPLTLHLAVIPRVAGQNLTVSVKQVEGVSIAATPVSIAKASAGGIYRQTLAITKSAAAPASLRVLVTMDMGEGKAFGFFSVPLDNGRNPQNKQDSVKQR